MGVVTVIQPGVGVVTVIQKGGGLQIGWIDHAKQEGLGFFGKQPLHASPRLHISLLGRKFIEKKDISGASGIQLAAGQGGHSSGCKCG